MASGPPGDSPECSSLPLSVAFDRAHKLHAHLSDGGAGAHAQLLALLEHCERLVEAGGLFSANEDQEDLSTTSMRYLLVPFMRGDALNTQPQPGGGGAAARLAQAAAARAALAAFLQRCSQYGLLGPACAASYEASACQQEQGDGGGGGATDPGEARNRKIERFRRSRAVQGLIQQLDARQRRADEEAGTEGGAPGGVGGWDEEDERLLWKMHLEAAALRALDALPLLEQELQLLKHAAASASGAATGGQQGQQPPGSSSRQQAGTQGGLPPQQQQQMMQRLSDIAGQLSLGQDRQAMWQQVLRPGHILPTLTVEQQGAIELRQARQREAAQREAAAAAAAAAAEARSDDEDEAALAKQRAWDDFVDDNPRGWGNSKLRPCA